MDCRHARELLSLYAEGELDGAREAQVAAHLAACPACRERVALDRELAARLAAFMPAEGLAARRTALRGKVMAEVEKERRWRPWRRAALQFGNAATWAMILAVTGALVLAIAVTWRPLAERAWPAGERATPAPAGIGWQVVQDEVIASPYYWVVDGERVDRTPQLSPDGTKIAYLPTVDGGATDIDRLVVRDLASGKDLDLTPEEGYSYTSVRWSPDSKTLAFVKYRGGENNPTLSQLWRVDADGGNLMHLYDAQWDGGPANRGPLFSVQRWSADGQHIWLDSTIWGGGHVAHRVRASDGRPEELTLPTAADLGARDDAQPGPIIFSPTDDYAVCVVKTSDLLSRSADAPEGGQSLVLYDLVARQARVLASFPHEISAIGPGDISPDGEWILVRPMAEQGRAGNWVVRRDGTGLRQLTLNGQSAPLYMPGPLWAGGGHAYFNQPLEVSAIWICEVDAASGEAGLIAHKSPARDLVSVSRDGRRLLAIRGEWEKATLVLLELAPRAAPVPTAAPTAEPPSGAPAFGAPRDLFELPPAAGADYSISPRRGWLAYMAPEEAVEGRMLPRRLIARHLETGQTVDLLENPPAEAQAVGWTGDLVPPQQSAIILVGGGNQQRGGLLIRDVSAQAPTIIALPQGTEQGFVEAAISPEGRRIAFTVAYETPQAPVPKIGIDVIGLDGSGRRQIVAPDYFIGKLAWSPDGTQIVYFKGKGGTPPEDGDAYVASVAGGEPTLLFPRLRLAAWSPSGAQALWMSEPADPQGKADLYLSAWPVAGPPQLVAKGASMGGAAWAGSDGWFVYGQDGALYLAENGGRERLVRLTPEGEQAGAPVWVPGMGLIFEAVRNGLATLRLLPLAASTPGPTGPDTAGLTVEEHAVTTVGTGFANTEGTEWIGREILDVRRAWREPSPAERVAATNEALRPFGYRLEAREKPGWSQAFYDLYQGDQVMLADLDTVWPVSVSAAGDDFALLVEKLNGGYYLVRASGSEKWDVSQHQYQPPVFVGGDLVSVTGIAELRNVTVLRGRLPVYTSFFVDWPPASYPVKGLWSWQGHWVLEVSGRVVMDGKDLNRQLGYDEIFGYRLIKGRPFYFFKQGGRIGVSYDGVTLPQQYDEVRHYGCCSAAAYNPGGNDTMTWFFGLRDGTWYYVEMGRYDAEEMPAPTAVPGEPTETPAATPKPGQGAGAFRAFNMIDARTGWALAERGVLRTSDGGVIWADVTPRDVATPASDGDVYWAGQCFLDTDHAWVAIAGSQETTVLRTADGGRNWQSSLLPVEGMGAQLSFADARRGWALVHQGAAAGSEGVAVLGTEDGGATWTVLSVADPQNPQPGQVPFAGSKSGLTFSDEANGWLPLFEPVSGKFFLYVTHDGGRTWAEQALALPAGYEEAQATPEAPVFFDTQEGVLAVGVWRHEPGRLFYITRDGGATWIPMPALGAAVGGSVVSEFVSADEGWALVAPVPGTTDKVELRHTMDGAQTWTALASGRLLEGVTALDFVDSQHGWAVCTGEDSTYLLRTTDGGRTWARVP